MKRCCLWFGTCFCSLQPFTVFTFDNYFIPLFSSFMVILAGLHHSSHSSCLQRIHSQETMHVIHLWLLSSLKQQFIQIHHLLLSIVLNHILCYYGNHRYRQINQDWNLKDCKFNTEVFSFLAYQWLPVWALTSDRQPGSWCPRDVCAAPTVCTECRRAAEEPGLESPEWQRASNWPAHCSQDEPPWMCHRIPYVTCFPNLHSSAGLLWLYILNPI